MEKNSSKKMNDLTEWMLSKTSRPMRLGRRTPLEQPVGYLSEEYRNILVNAFNNHYITISKEQINKVKKFLEDEGLA